MLRDLAAFLRYVTLIAIRFYVLSYLPEPIPCPTLLSLYPYFILPHPTLTYLNPALGCSRVWTLLILDYLVPTLPYQNYITSYPTLPHIGLLYVPQPVGITAVGIASVEMTLAYTK